MNRRNGLAAGLVLCLIPAALLAWPGGNWLDAPGNSAIKATNTAQQVEIDGLQAETNKYYLVNGARQGNGVGLTNIPSTAITEADPLWAAWTNAYRVVIGNGAICSGGAGIAIGSQATAEAQDSIQLGGYPNASNGSFQVNQYQMLSKDGKIPIARLETNVYAATAWHVARANGADHAIWANWSTGAYHAVEANHATNADTLGGMTAGQFVFTNSATFWGGVESNVWGVGVDRKGFNLNGAVSNATYTNCLFLYSGTTNNAGNVGDFSYCNAVGTAYDRVYAIRARGSFTAPNDTSQKPDASSPLNDGSIGGPYNWQTQFGAGAAVHWWAMEADGYALQASSANAFIARGLTNDASFYTRKGFGLVGVGGMTASRYVGYELTMCGSVLSPATYICAAYVEPGNGVVTEVAGSSGDFDLGLWRDSLNSKVWLVLTSAQGNAGVGRFNGRMRVWPGSQDGTFTADWDGVP